MPMNIAVTARMKATCAGSRRETTSIINIVIPQTSEFIFSNPFYSQILKGIGLGARKRKYYLLISLFPPINDSEFGTISLSSGVLILSNRLEDEPILKARLQNLPTVAIPGKYEFE